MIPKWKDNQPASLALLVLAAFLVMFLWAKTSLAVREARHVGKADLVEHDITVEGVGKALATPDIATISFSVETRGSETAAVQDKNTNTMNALLEKVKALGIPADDIQTSNYSVSQDFRYDPQTGQSTPTGWIVSQMVTVKVRDTSKTSDVLRTAGQNGATNVSGPNFAIDDPSTLLAQARQKAIADAQKNAVALANTLGVRLERVVGYTEYAPGGSPMPYFNAKAEGLGGGGMAPSIQLGQNEVDLNVSVVYKLAD
jgi:uncharacterized protein YggE